MPLISPLMPVGCALNVRIYVRQNLTSLTPLFKGSDMPTKVPPLLEHGSNFGQMPFLLPPMTDMGTSGN